MSRKRAFHLMSGLYGAPVRLQHDGQECTDMENRHTRWQIASHKKFNRCNQLALIRKPLSVDMVTILLAPAKPWLMLCNARTWPRNTARLPSGFSGGLTAAMNPEHVAEWAYHLCSGGQIQCSTTKCRECAYHFLDFFMSALYPFKSQYLALSLILSANAATIFRLLKFTTN